MTYLEVNELYHHGVKGQQWGVRNGPPYPIDKDNHQTTIKKGSKFYRISVWDESTSTGHAYVTYLKSDNARYRGFFGQKLLMNHRGKKPVYSIEMTANEDLLSPTKQERVETFIKLYNEDPVLRTRLGDYKKKDWHSFTPLPKKFYEMQYSNLKDNELVTKGYETFVKSLGGDEYIRSRYFKELSKKGYTFVADDLDGGKFGKAPAIILDRQKSVTYKGQQQISKKEIKETWRKYGTALRKEDR